MKQSYLHNSWIVLLIVVLMTSIGCSLTTTTDTPSDVHSIEQVHAPASAIWLAIANSVDSHSVTTTNHLARLVAVLNRNGDLQQTDIASFDDAFPDATRAERVLTSDDADRLRLLSRRSRQ